jgi:hypothetical protein
MPSTKITGFQKNNKNEKTENLQFPKNKISIFSKSWLNCLPVGCLYTEFQSGKVKNNDESKKILERFSELE